VVYRLYLLRSLLSTCGHETTQDIARYCPTGALVKMTRAEFISLCADVAILEMQGIDAPMLATANR